MNALKAIRDSLWRNFAYVSWLREEERRETEATAASLEMARAIERDGRGATFNSTSFVGTDEEKRAAYQAAHAEHIAPFEALIPDVIAADEEAERERAHAAEQLAWHEERLKAEAARAQKLADEVAALHAFAPPGQRFVYLGIELVALGTTDRFGEAVLVAEHVQAGAIVEARFGADHLPALRSERWRDAEEARALREFREVPADWRGPHD